MNDQIKAFLNLDNWSETVGTTCVGGIVCPHCRAKFAPETARGLGLEFAKSKGTLICRACRGTFDVKIADIPVGKAWVTEAGVRAACECNGTDCFLTVDLPLNEAAGRGKLVLIVDGCKHGPDSSDVLVEQRGGYGLYREGGRQCSPK